MLNTQRACDGRRAGRNAPRAAAPRGPPRARTDNKSTPNADTMTRIHSNMTQPEVRIKNRQLTLPLGFSSHA